MKNANVVLDFTLNKSMEDFTAGQPVAVMPAELAKRALKALSANLSQLSETGIIRHFRDSLSECTTVQQSVECAINYIQERELIANIVAGNWDAYKQVEREEV
jgi:predicted transcriptional regulator